MPPALQSKILGLIEPAKPSAEEQKLILEEWDDYFRYAQVVNHEKEFTEIISARFLAGSFSIRAPEFRLGPPGLKSSIENHKS